MIGFTPRRMKFKTQKCKICKREFEKITPQQNYCSSMECNRKRLQRNGAGGWEKQKAWKLAREKALKQLEALKKK